MHKGTDIDICRQITRQITRQTDMEYGTELNIIYILKHDIHTLRHIAYT